MQPVAYRDDHVGFARAVQLVVDPQVELVGVAGGKLELHLGHREVSGQAEEKIIVDGVVGVGGELETVRRRLLRRKCVGVRRDTASKVQRCMGLFGDSPITRHFFVVVTGVASTKRPA